ncbi:MAG: hypothetical protein GKR89_35390 [Candidatus Latescibacteria bacterium]|nr:hypothetical protein [Candidatus Latescibacterota bacterium]
MDRNTSELIEQLGAPHHADRNRAYRALAHLEQQATPALDQALAHPNWRVRSAAALLLDRAAGPDSAHHLAQALQDPIAQVRRNALHALVCDRCKSQPLDIDAVGLVVDRALNDHSLLVRRRAAATLGDFPPQDPRRQQALVALLQDPDPIVRQKAHWAQHRPPPRQHTFACPHCQTQVDWSQCRQAMRDKPKCHACQQQLVNYNDRQWYCPSCSRNWTHSRYRQSLKKRARLPCPSCSDLIRRSYMLAQRQEA